MRCIICQATDKWENVDKFRLKPSGMAICTNCAFVSYPSKWKTKEEIIQHYRKDYRNPPSHNNLYTGQRKIHFHNAFLGPVFEGWKKAGKKSPKVFEVGAAYGMALAWIRDAYPGAEVDGTELTTSYKRNAFHEFGLKLKDDFDDTKKYDLIMSYKVAEHQLDFDLELARYANCLTNDGLLYISVPTWFGSMTNFGMGGFDLEYYYDPNHINVWTRQHFESLLARMGFEIIQQDHAIYDSTYLCKKTHKYAEVKLPSVEEIKTALEKIKESYLHFAMNAFDQALASWPNFPTAHVNRAEMIRAKAFEKGWDFIKENIIDYAIKSCPDAVESFVLAADFSMRAGKWDEAIQYAEKSLQMKPENPVALLQLINIMREIHIRATTEDQKIHYAQEAKKIALHLKAVSAQHFREAMDLIYLFNSKLPYEGENAQP